MQAITWKSSLLVERITTNKRSLKQPAKKHIFKQIYRETSPSLELSNCGRAE